MLGYRVDLLWDKCLPCKQYLLFRNLDHSWNWMRQNFKMEGSQDFTITRQNLNNPHYTYGRCFAFFQWHYIYLQSVEFQSSVHTCACNVSGIATEADTSCSSSVIIKYLELGPLFAKVDADIGSRNGQICATLVKGHVAYFVAIIQLDGLEVLQFAQVP